MLGLPPPRPALLGPPPEGISDDPIPPEMSFTLSLGAAAARRAAKPLSGPGGLPGAEGADCAERSIG